MGDCSSQRSPSPFAERRFFDFAATAESLHRHLRPDEKRFDASVVRATQKSVMTLIPEDQRSAFEGAMQRVNELTYADRVERLLDRIPSLVRSVVGDDGQQKAFRKLVGRLRNVEAHRLPRNSGLNVGGETLVRLAAKLKPVLDAWILAELGIADDALEAAMRSNRRYWYYASKESWPWDARDHQ